MGRIGAAGRSGRFDPDGRQAPVGRPHRLARFGRPGRRARLAPRLRSGEFGQATVELALLLPLVFGLLLLVVQVALVTRDQILLQHATREAARGVALEGDPGAATAGAAGTGLLGDRFQLTVEPVGEDSLFAVQGRYRSPMVVPLIRLAREEVTLQSRLVVRAEPP